ncbi:hypothetical protein T08_4283 [Trichinella sp. T8]|nr:hypothetical protein T08_4283 [Trichinella sp. T8]
MHNTDATTTHIMLSWIVDHVQKNQECTNHKIISQYAVVSEKHGLPWAISPYTNYANQHCIVVT